MPLFKADLHMHTILSPCGDIEMTPVQIVDKALRKGLDIIAITDHNCTRQAAEVQRVGKRNGLEVYCGAEVTSREEAHCVCLMPDADSLDAFQTYLSAHLPHIPNDPDFFGYQLWVNEEEEVLGEEEYLLISALDQNLEEIEAFVHSLGGLFIPAHINKSRNSVVSQLGFISPDLNADALELSRHTTPEAFVAANPYLKGRRFLQSSDAHCLEDIGCVCTLLDMEHRNFQSFIKYLKQ